MRYRNLLVFTIAVLVVSLLFPLLRTYLFQPLILDHIFISNSAWYKPLPMLTWGFIFLVFSVFGCVLCYLIKSRHLWLWAASLGVSKTILLLVYNKTRFPHAGSSGWEYFWASGIFFMPIAGALFGYFIYKSLSGSK